MPGPLIVVLIIAVVVLVALVGLAAVRQLVPHEGLIKHADVSGYVYAVIGVLYGVILAQVVVAAWEEYRDARGVAADEAYAVLNLDRLSRSWPEDVRAPIHDALIAYAEEVINDEWPAMEAGDYRMAPRSVIGDRLWSVYDQIGQGPEGNSAKYAASLDQLDDLDDARRSRFVLGEMALPQTMTLTLLIGAVVTVGFAYLFAIENTWLHGVIVTCLAVLVALLLLLEYQLETPYQGVDSIGPTAMQIVLDELRAASHESRTSAP
jgi:hypothetical protein